MVFLKFEFVCVAIARGGLDGCFGFGVKAVPPHAAKRGLEGKERMLVRAYQQRIEGIRIGILEEQAEKKKNAYFNDGKLVFCFRTLAKRLPTLCQSVIRTRALNGGGDMWRQF